jgi:hypothetical protein
LVANTLDEFEAILLDLVTDKEKRADLAMRWHDIVRDRYTYESMAFVDNGRPVPNAMRWLSLAREVLSEDEDQET